MNKYNNFGVVYGNVWDGKKNSFRAAWCETDTEMRTQDGFDTRKDANAFLRSKNIEICTWREFNKRSQFR